MNDDLQPPLRGDAPTVPAHRSDRAKRTDIRTIPGLRNRGRHWRTDVWPEYQRRWRKEWQPALRRGWYRAQTLRHQGQNWLFSALKHGWFQFTTWLEEQIRLYRMHSMSICIGTIVEIEAKPTADETAPLAPSAYLYRVGDLKDPARLIFRLNEAKDPLTQFIRQSLAPEVHELLAKHDGKKAPTEALQMSLIEEMNRLILGQNLYLAHAEKPVRLTAEMRQGLAQYPQAGSRAQLNRLLLEQAFPYELAKRPRLVSPESRHGEPVHLRSADLVRHLYVLGASGSGKTKCLENLLRELIHCDHGCCLIDPHGDLVQALGAFLYQYTTGYYGLKPDFAKVYLIEPFQDDSLIGFNALDPCGGPLYPHISELVGIFHRMWANTWGPRMEELLRNTLLVLALAGLTLIEVAPFLTDVEVRNSILNRISDETLLDYFRNRYDTMTGANRTAASEPVLNKMGTLLADPRLRAMFGQQQGLNLRRLMDDGAIILLNCSRGHLRESSSLLGSLFLAQLQSAAMSRSDIPEHKRRPFTILVDEFQHFRGDDFETILSESRKYGLRLVLAHQYLAQLDPSLQSAIFGNVGTHVFFSLGPKDATAVAKELADDDNRARELNHLPVRHVLLHRRGQPTLRLQTTEIVNFSTDDSTTQQFIASLRSQHGKPLAAIDEEIRQRHKDLRQRPRPSTAPPPSETMEGLPTSPPPTNAQEDDDD